VIAAIHADAIALLSKTGRPDARLVAVTDVAGGAAAAFAAAHGCRAEPDLGTLLARPDVEVVCVCAPSGLHAVMARNSYSYGEPQSSAGVSIEFGT
jgi:UDP-N-acetyl-2-amino-2-deoxyglucuronate dehydrogenase